MAFANYFAFNSKENELRVCASPATSIPPSRCYHRAPHYGNGARLRHWCGHRLANLGSEWNAQLFSRYSLRDAKEVGSDRGDDTNQYDYNGR